MKTLITITIALISFTLFGQPHDIHEVMGDNFTITPENTIADETVTPAPVNERWYVIETDTILVARFPRTAVGVKHSYEALMGILEMHDLTFADVIMESDLLPNGVTYTDFSDINLYVRLGECEIKRFYAFDRRWLIAWVVNSSLHQIRIMPKY